MGNPAGNALMHKRLLIAAGFTCLPAAAYAACSTSTPIFTTGQGTFETLAGKMYAPDGTVFVPHGINVLENQFNISTVQQIINLAPGTNFLRIPIYDYADPLSFQAAVNLATSHGIMVEFENHANFNADGSSAGNSGGARGVILSGQGLTTEQAWYAAVAKDYGKNPEVAAGTANEPSVSTTDNGPSNPAALYNWQQTTINTLRANGFTGLIFVEAYNSFTSGGDPLEAGLPSGAFSKDTGIVLDDHFYAGNIANGSNNPADAAKALSGAIATAQSRITTASGPIPFTSLEFGDSTMGATPDPNGMTAVQAVLNSATGGAAWMWGSNSAGGDALLNANGTLTSFGTAVAAWTETSGATGCAITALSSPVVVPSSLSITASDTDITAAANATELTDSPSIADVAALASQGLGANGQSITMSNGVNAPSGASFGSTQLAQPLAVDSPSGTMTPPPPVSASTSFTASGNYQTIIPDPGNATGTVSGIGNTIDATGGIQTITVTGSGNTVTTGPYDDIITVQTSGNTIDTGGGNDTVILAYGGKIPTTTINADAAAVAPLASAGNIIVAPSLGTGSVTIQGVLATNDRIDVTRSLIGLAGYNGANAWNYLTASSSAQGCILSVNGQPIVILPAGAPSGNIGSFIVAHAPT